MSNIERQLISEKVISILADEKLSYAEAERVLEDVNMRIKNHALITSDKLISQSE